MKFCIVINEGPYTHQASDSAYQFCRAALETGHEVLRVFFYQDGVYNGSRLATPPRDDRDIGKRWRALGEAHGLDLVACIAAAQRRGMVDAAERQRHGLDGDNLAEGFRIGGLGQLIDSVIDADRTVTFGD